MAAVTVSGMATSFDLPNYIGELFQVRERPNNFLRLIGGLSGQVGLVGQPVFSMGVDYELGTPSQKGALEGAAPSSSEVGTTQSTNILQIFHESVKLSYTRQSDSSTIGGLAVIPGASAQGPLNHPGSLAWQIDRKLEVIQNQMNWNFLRGAYQAPANNSTARQTRGVRTAVTTNLFANSGTPRAISKAIFAGALKDAMENGMFQMGSTVYCFGNADQLDALIALYIGETGVIASREIAGFQLREIITTWARVVLVYEPDMPAGELFLTRADKIRPVAMPIVADGQNKGILFAEPLAKTGSADEYQLYGEWGVDYTHEVYHAVIDDLS